MCVCELVHFFTENWKGWIFCSVFKIFLPNILSWARLNDWPHQNFKNLSVSLSVGSLVYFLDSYKYLSSLLIEFYKTFNICPKHYFCADCDCWMMLKVTVRVIGLGTIVTWPSCRPLVLFWKKGKIIILKKLPEIKWTIFKCFFASLECIWQKGESVNWKTCVSQKFSRFKILW